MMNQLGSKKEEFKDSFKPLMPQSWIKDYNTWLTTTEIEESIQQHEIEQTIKQINKMLVLT